MKDDELIEKLKKIKPKYIDTTPYENRVRQKIEMRFQRARRKRVIFRRLSFVSGVLVVLFFAILMPFIYGRSGEISLLRSGDIIPQVITVEKTIKIIDNVQQPFVYDKETQTIWFIGEINNLYAVFYTDLSGGKTNMLSPAVDNLTGIRGDIKILDDKVYAGIGDYLYVINKKTHEVSIIQLSKEKLPIKNYGVHPIKTLLPLTGDKIIISRDNAYGITFYNPISYHSNNYKLPLDIESPFTIVTDNNKEACFITHFIKTGKIVSGMLNLKNRSVILFNNISATHIFYVDGVFTEFENALFRIDVKNKVFHKIDIETGKNAHYIEGEDGIYIISNSEKGISISKYIPETNTLALFKEFPAECKEILGIIEKDSTLFLIVPNEK